MLKAGATQTSVPITIDPITTGAVDVALDGFVDESTGSRNERKLSSGGVFRLGDPEYPIGATENLQLKKDGRHVRTYQFRQTGSDKVVLKMKATSTSAADFTLQAVKPKLFKRHIPKPDVTEIVADVVSPDGAAPTAP